MDKKKIGIAVGCAAIAAVIAICAVTFGGKKGNAAEPAATVETAAAAEPAATPEVTATPAPTEAPTATPEPTAEPTATPEPTAAPHARCDRRTAACCYRRTPARTAGAERR